MTRPLHKGMGEAVARRTILRGSETWDQVSRRVAFGNALLDPRGLVDYDGLQKHITNGSVLMSGRHLQHGDHLQPERNSEVFTNCATSATSSMLFYLLLNGSGVGRAYDDALMLVDWSFMPDVKVVLSQDHPDFTDVLGVESAEEARAKYPEAEWHEVGDSREGWTKSVARIETLTYQRVHRDETVVLDFTPVRCKGSKIKGMQDRPASGPGPLMEALRNVARVKYLGFRPWKATMFVDHHLAECVLVGGARRAARIATKYWKDSDILEFIDIKKKAGLWTANNSVAVTKEFWRQKTKKAQKIFEAVSEASYKHGTGEPGWLNVDRLTAKDDDLEKIYGDGDFLDSPKYRLDDDEKCLYADLAKAVIAHPYHYIVNPCQPADAPLLTPDGLTTMGEIQVGDTIWSEDGWVRVERKQENGVQPVYAYETTAGKFSGTKEHLVVEGDQKTPAGDAAGIDILAGPTEHCADASRLPITVMDGLMIGDGTRHTTSASPTYLTVGVADQDYFDSEVGGLFQGEHAAKYGLAWKVSSSVTPDELPPLPVRQIPARHVNADPARVRAFLRGLFSANGSVVHNRVTLKATSKTLVDQAQLMLSSVGIRSYVTHNVEASVTFNNGEYVCKPSYDLNITLDRHRFAETIGFIQKAKTVKLLSACAVPSRGGKRTYDVKSVTFRGNEEVYDIKVSGPSHTYWSGGHNVSNCGEIALFILGGYCVIGDVVPYHAKDLDHADEAFRLTTRALIRTNLMPSLYKAEVARTNRIGVSMTGIHEFAWKFFGYGFRDLIDEEQSLPFWQTLSRFKRAVRDECETYSRLLGVVVPHTDTTLKPAGSTSKLYGLTEAAHLPSMRRFLRWVQFTNEDPLVTQYQEMGYPTRKLEVYKGHTIVGFPTEPEITKIGMGDAVVTAPEATPEEQFKWLMLLEKYWIRGVDENGDPLEEYGNQVSYTLKYDPDDVSYDAYREVILENMPRVRACSVMPVTDLSAYEYLPEDPITDAEFAEIVEGIDDPDLVQEISLEELACSSGACPL